ncbi:hypothetical protein [Kineococcus sp. SYSU DK005]|uniref:hypothetical protein n=1 Tax=Kineococcus sp. SYSU DK005 TaxID=3383126 RepID=UPI003D7DC53E
MPDDTAEVGFDVVLLVLPVHAAVTGLEVFHLLGHVYLLRALGQLLWPQRTGGVGYAAEVTSLLLLTALLQQFAVVPLSRASGAPVLFLTYWVLLPSVDLLVALSAAVVAVGARREPRWWLLAAGTGVFAVGDVAFSVLSVRGEPPFGSGLDVLWVAGIVLFAVAATRPRRALPPTNPWGAALHPYEPGDGRDAGSGAGEGGDLLLAGQLRLALGLEPDAPAGEWAALGRMGCDLGQGHLHGPPVPPAQFEQRERQRCAPAPAAAGDPRAAAVPGRPPAVG